MCTNKTCLPHLMEARHVVTYKCQLFTPIARCLHCTVNFIDIFSMRNFHHIVRTFLYKNKLFLLKLN